MHMHLTNVVRLKGTKLISGLWSVLCRGVPYPISLSENQGGSAPQVFRVGGGIFPQPPWFLRTCCWCMITWIECTFCVGRTFWVIIICVQSLSTSSVLLVCPLGTCTFWRAVKGCRETFYLCHNLYAFCHILPIRMAPFKGSGWVGLPNRLCESTAFVELGNSLKVSGSIRQ